MRPQASRALLRACTPCASLIFLPFLYQTRTLTSLPSRRSIAQEKTHKSYGAFGEHRRAPHAPEQPDDEVSSEEPIAIPYRKPSSTITASERAIFTRIFKDIIDSAGRTPRRRRPAPEARPGTSLSEGVEGEPASDDADPSMSDATETLDSIFAPALQATSRAPARFGVSFVPSQKEPVKDRQESDQQALARYPAALRAAAARATSVSRGRLRRQGQDQANEDTAATEEAHAQAISQQRLEEVQRIEGLLRAAPTDFALWNVLDREVFSMIGSLGLDKVSKSTKRRTKSTPSTPPVNKSPGQEPDSMTRLAIVSSIYPQLLLLAMRILQHDFRSPSACLALLAQIKALGPISHVLGASTAIYNDILLLQWKAYGDPGAVASTLDEMDATGVEGDAGTATVVHRILEERKKQLRLQRWKGRPTTPAMLYALESYLVGFGSLSRWRAVFRARVAAAAAAQKMERQEEGEGDEEEEYEEPAETKVTSR